MAFTTVSTVNDWMYRGSPYSPVVQVRDENGDPKNIAGIDSDPKLYLYKDYTRGEPAIEKEGEILSTQNGTIRFKITTEDTKSLPAITYDLIVIIEEDGEPYPLLRKRFALKSVGPPIKEGI